MKLDFESMWRESVQVATKRPLLGHSEDRTGFAKLTDFKEVVQSRWEALRKDFASHCANLLPAVPPRAAGAEQDIKQRLSIKKLNRGTCRVLLEVVSAHTSPEDKACSLLYSFLKTLELCRIETDLSLSQQRAHEALHGAFEQVACLIETLKQHLLLACCERIFRVRPIVQVKDCLASLERALPELHHTACTTTQPIDRSPTHPRREGIVASCARSSERKSMFHYNTNAGSFGIYQRSYGKLRVSGQARVVQGDYHQHIYVTGKKNERWPEYFIQYNSRTFRGGEPNLSAFFLQTNCASAPKLNLAPGTGKHIFNEPTWLDWVQTKPWKLLVLTGPLGSGKTSYCISILEKLSADPSRVVLSYFFKAAQCASGNAVQLFLTSIISQLWNAHRETAKEQVEPDFFSYQRVYKNIFDCPDDVLVDIAGILIDFVRPYALLVDGVDECGSEQESVIATLDKIVNGKGLVAVAASRRFGPFNHLQNTVRFDLSPAILREDLKLVIHHELSNKLNLRGQGKEELREQVSHFILKNAQDNFLHAKLLVEIISKKTTQNQVKRIMDNFTFKQVQDLFARYEHLNTMIESSLLDDERIRRIYLLQIVAAAREPWKLGEIDEFLAIDIKSQSRDDGELSSDIRGEVERLGQSFLQIGPTGEVTFYHTAARDFFLGHSFTIDDANLYLARKCIAVLSQPYYRDANRAAKLLRKHIIRDTKYSSTPDEAFSESPMYEYAVKHFHEHVVRVPTPPEDLVTTLGQFLHGTEFVSWSEALFNLQKGGSFNSHNVVFKTLLLWVEHLPPHDRKEIAIDDYFEVPHVLLAEILKDRRDDAILQYLPRIRIGDFFNGAAQREEDWRKAVKNKEIVVAGLSDILEPKDRFLLKARAVLYQEYFWQKKFIEAREQLLELYKLQMEVAGDCREDAYETAWLLGYAYIALGEYEEAGKLLQNAANRVQALYGKEYWLFLLLYFLEGERLDAIQDLDKAKTHYEAVHKTLVALVGNENGFTLMVKTALGSLLRKQQCFKEAEDLLFIGYAGRELIFTLEINVNVDAAMQLALMYRDKGAGEKCIEKLDLIAESEVFRLDFERYCQQIHLRALVAFDNGLYEEPKRLLLTLLGAAEGETRHKNNRELLWVRIDLADVMRRHGEVDEALMLFTDLVRSRKKGEEDLGEEPEPASQLKIAEKALRLVRKAQILESRLLLDGNDLEWVRDADFWILTQGGPIIDTAIIRF